jgi:YHS domain-containing protein
MRYIFLEIIVPLLAFLLLRSILRSIFGTARNVARQQHSATAQAPTVVAGGELMKDPVCGTYVSTALSITRAVNGEMVHFCSKECRDKYRAA